MHVVEIATTDVRLRGAIAQRPLVDGLVGRKNVPLTRLLRLLSVVSLDRLGSLVGRLPIYITASAAAGGFGAIWLIPGGTVAGCGSHIHCKAPLRRVGRGLTGA
jgi:hypothetical protein